MGVTRKFIEAVKLSDIPAYRLAQKAGISPMSFYKITAGIDQPKPGDQRVIAVCHVLGMRPEDCFESEVPRD